MVKLLHAADLHLDSPFAGLEPEEALARRRLQRGLPLALARLARAAGLARAEDTPEQGARAFLDWIRAANRAMDIPETIPEIRPQDIPTMARHADQECNPLYPVPKLMDRAGLEAMYHKLMPKEVTLWTSKPSSRPSGPITAVARHSA